jgi:hypothetical protein
VLSIVLLSTQGAYYGSSPGAIAAVAKAHHYKVVNLTFGLDLVLVREDVWAPFGSGIGSAAVPQWCHKEWWGPIRPSLASNLVDVAVLLNGGSLCASRKAAAAHLRELSRISNCKPFSLLGDLPDPSSSSSASLFGNNGGGDYGCQTATSSEHDPPPPTQHDGSMLLGSGAVGPPPKISLDEKNSLFSLVRNVDNILIPFTSSNESSVVNVPLGPFSFSLGDSRAQLALRLCGAVAALTGVSTGVSRRSFLEELCEEAAESGGRVDVSPLSELGGMVDSVLEMYFVDSSLARGFEAGDWRTLW